MDEKKVTATRTIPIFCRHVCNQFLPLVLTDPKFQISHWISLISNRIRTEHFVFKTFLSTLAMKKFMSYEQQKSDWVFFCRSLPHSEWFCTCCDHLSLLHYIIVSIMKQTTRWRWWIHQFPITYAEHTWYRASLSLSVALSHTERPLNGGSAAFVGAAAPAISSAPCLLCAHDNLSTLSTFVCLSCCLHVAFSTCLCYVWMRHATVSVYVTFSQCWSTISL